MGMAASQARYIELTARKTNVEYEGQQINQQRTALSNESAGMFSQLMSLNVPVPPSTDNYTTTQYTFNDGNNECVVNDVQPLSGSTLYNSTVSYSYNLPIYTGVKKVRTDLGVSKVVSGTDTTYWLTDGAAGGKATNQTNLIQCSTTDKDYANDVKALTAVVSKAGVGDNIASKTLGFDPTSTTTQAATIGNIWKYYGANGVASYYDATDLETIVSKSGYQGQAVSTQSYYATDIETAQNFSEPANVTKSSTGRYSTIQLQSEPGTTLNLTASTTTDNVAYTNAMNEYEYQQNLYAKAVEDINAKTEVIEQEDRTLEMKLKQLDTEQEALQTEMDAVKKVIDKNIEQTFKTFS